MSAWHQALQNVWVSDPVICCRIECLHAGDGLGVCPRHDGCDGVADYEQFRLTKLDFVKKVKSDGWAYDGGGNWLCPACSQ